MAESVEPESAPRREPRRSRRDPISLPWSGLFRQRDAQGALGELVSAFDHHGKVAFTLEILGAASPPIASVSSRQQPDRQEQVQAEEVAGSPAWLLKSRSSARGRPARGELKRIASALEAWRVVHAERDRTQERLAARTRELDLLQGMARWVAEASTPEGLFAAAAAAFHRAFGDELVVAVHALGGFQVARAFLGRPVSEADIERALRRGCQALGWADGPVSVDVEHLESFDAGSGTRGGIREQDLVVLPIRRGGRILAALVALPSGAQDEGRIRIGFSAANQVSLQLDRILTAREAEQDRFRSILDSMPQAVILTDRSLRVLSANPVGAALLERLGQGPGGLERVGDLDLNALGAEVLEGRGTVVGEAKLEDGMILDVTLSAVASETATGKDLLLVLTDVTERRRLQTQLAQAEKLSSLGQMISGIAHELNNPLSSVLGYAQLLRASSGAEERVRRRLEVIDREARRCQRIVQSLLSFARRHDPERRLLSLNEVAESVLSLMAYQLRVDGIQVRSELARELPPVLGDPHELQQALLNLVTNAQHALRAEGRGGTLTVRTRTGDPGSVHLEVEDDGPGVPEQIREKIFDPFFTTKSPEKGTGLGLSIACGIAESHGGAIRVGDRSGGGAAFSIELPVGARRGSPARDEQGAVVTEDGPRGTILVVDDEESLARLVCEALEEDGHRAVAAHDEAEALREIAAAAFDLVISDLRMPGTTIEGFREKIERLRPGLSRRLLLTTGDTVSPEPQHLARREGIPLLHKPFDLEDLRRMVRSWLAAGRELGTCDT